MSDPKTDAESYVVFVEDLHGHLNGFERKPDGTYERPRTHHRRKKLRPQRADVVRLARILKRELAPLERELLERWE